MKLITYEEISSAGIAPRICYLWAEEMIANKNISILPPKISIKPSPGVFCNVMPCMIGMADDNQQNMNCVCGGGKSCYSISRQATCVRQ